MKSGLEDRNNSELEPYRMGLDVVSMKSGLEDRNNVTMRELKARGLTVSMKSGLEDRNNNARIQSCLRARLSSQ